MSISRQVKPTRTRASTRRRKRTRLTNTGASGGRRVGGADRDRRDPEPGVRRVERLSEAGAHPGGSGRGAEGGGGKRNVEGGVRQLGGQSADLALPLAQGDDAAGGLPRGQGQDLGPVAVLLGRQLGGHPGQADLVLGQHGVADHHAEQAGHQHRGREEGGQAGRGARAATGGGRPRAGASAGAPVRAPWAADAGQWRPGVAGVMTGPPVHWCARPPGGGRWWPVG